MNAIFKPDTQMTFERKVTFNMPGQAGGFTQVSLPTTFRSVPKEELDELQQECHDSEAYARVVLGVKLVGDDQGNELPAEAGKTAMAQVSSFVYEAMLTYYDVMLGGNLKQKTSRRRRATG